MRRSWWLIPTAHGGHLINGQAAFSRTSRQSGLFGHRRDVKATLMGQHEIVVQPSLASEFGDKNFFLQS